MKNTIFTFLKVGMIATFVGLAGYIVYVFKKPAKKDDDSHNDSNIHTMKKAS